MEQRERERRRHRWHPSRVVDGRGSWTNKPAEWEAQWRADLGGMLAGQVRVRVYRAGVDVQSTTLPGVGTLMAFAGAVHAGGDEADHVCEAAAKGKFTRTVAPVAHVALTPLVHHLYECLTHRGWDVYVCDRVPQ